MRYVDGVLDGDAGDLVGWLVPKLAEARLAAVRTSFLTMPGVEVIAPAITRMLESGGTFHAVVGGHPEQTDPGALRMLAVIVEDFPDRASLHLASPAVGWQNAKTYYIRDARDRAVAYVGSANLTGAGMTRNHEAGVIFDSETDDKALLEAVFDGVRAWAEHPYARLATPEVVIAFAEQARWSRIGRSRRPGPADPSWRLAETLPGTLDAIEAISAQGAAAIGIPTGLADLDALINGLQPGSLVVVGARPALGKSTLLLNFVRHASIKHEIPSLLFSLEQSADEINMRMLSAEARVALHAIRSGYMQDDDWTRLATFLDEIAEAPIHLNTTGNLTVQALAEEATRLVRDQDVRLVVVDYLQLLSPGLRAESREREVSEMVRELKILAKDLKVPVVVAAQLNRGPEQRTDKKPLLADLRESDAIAQVADIVILLHREDAYERESPRAGEADLIVAKHKNEPAATVTVAFQGRYSRFVDMAL